ncbi:MAG: Ig-like domain-containing protein, partial [Chloroflexota bacterium]|nr:Ig-like domain-containing protein [Chloroflexota bacterium]
VRKMLGLVDGLAIELPRARLKGLAAAPHVRSVEIDGTVTILEPAVAAATTGDLEYDNAWGVEHIGAKPVHDAGIRGAGIKVAVIDTGIDYIHDDPDDLPYVVDPEFNSNYRGGYDFFNNDADPFDDNGHGTHVAGSLAAEKNSYLVVGVAPQVDLYALKILGATGEGDVSNLIAALDWAVMNDMDVVNMSLGTHEVSPALASAVSAASAAGVMLVAASGNTTLSELFAGCPVAYPGAYPEVLSTTFTNPNDALTGYSCTGPEVDFASPGDAIFSPVPIGPCANCSALGYAAQSGTSMASPHLAGTVALLLSAGIADTGTPGFVDDVKARLCATADVGYGVQSAFGSTPIPRSDPRYPKYFGCGVINAEAAVLGLVPPPPANNPPIAVDDTATTAEDNPVSIPVKANDSDPDSDPISITAIGTPTAGSAVLAVGGNAIVYTPAANATASVTFAYTISDGRGGSDSATVTVTISPTQDPPVAVNDAATTAEDTAIDIAVLANDSDPDGDVLSVTGVSGALGGVALINPDGTVRFVPTANAVGAASFDYTVSDGQGGTDLGSVSVSLTPVNDPPVAANDSATTGQGSPITISVLANDSDIEGTPLGVASVSDPPHGTAVSNANGTITYTPDAGYSGPDAFGYSATDGSAASNVATVSITVTPAPPPPPPASFHVGDLDRLGTISGKTWTARVTIRIDSATHVGLSGAVVTGSWSQGSSGTGTCTTATNGTCSIQKTKLSRSAVASVRFTVTGVTRTGGTYEPITNHDPGGESNGTTIVILRPA